MAQHIYVDGDRFYCGKLLEKDPSKGVTRLSCLAHIKLYFVEAETKDTRAGWFIDKYSQAV